MTHAYITHRTNKMFVFRQSQFLQLVLHTCCYQKLRENEDSADVMQYGKLVFVVQVIIVVH